MKFIASLAEQRRIVAELDALPAESRRSLHPILDALLRALPNPIFKGELQICDLQRVHHIKDISNRMNL